MRPENLEGTVLDILSVISFKKGHYPIHNGTLINNVKF